MKKLKKVVVKTPLDPRYMGFFNLLDNYELLQIHRLDKDYIYATQKFIFKNHMINPKDLMGKFGIEFLEILAEDFNKKEYYCFVKHRWLEELHNFFTNDDIIIEPPIKMEDNSLITTFISQSKSIDIILNNEKTLYGNSFKILSISTVLPNTENLNLLLTERQKEIINYTVKMGYYEIPREVDSSKLADYFGISKSAFCEHLRKIERTIFQSIFRKEV